jgi:hypothetical protein
VSQKYVFVVSTCDTTERNELAPPSQACDRVYYTPLSLLVLVAVMLKQNLTKLKFLPRNRTGHMDAQSKDQLSAAAGGSVHIQLNPDQSTSAVAAAAGSSLADHNQ